MSADLDRIEKKFTYVVIPDTQIVTMRHPDIFRQLCQWIVDHRQELNIQMVLHLGDVVHCGAEEEHQYRTALEALNIIDQAQIPLLITPGNHDYDNMLKTDRSLSLFNRYFGLQRWRHQPWYGGVYEEGEAANAWAELHADGDSYLFLSIEFGPRPEVIEWASSVISEHPDHKVVIITHCYMYMYGERTKPGDQHNPKDYLGQGAADGEDLWQRLVRKHANIVAVYSGHQISENISYRTDIGDEGNIVFQSFQNWQAAEAGGEGRARLVTYDRSRQQMQLSVYNPYQEQFEDLTGYRVEVNLNPSEGNCQRQFP